MINLPSVQLLESRHTFPCSYTFKVIGTAADNFTARVVSIVRDEMQIERDPPYSFRAAQNGLHIAVTIEPFCQSSQQVLAIYSRLSGIDGLVMML
jgi:uncharacterized protein